MYTMYTQIKVRYVGTDSQSNVVMRVLEGPMAGLRIALPKSCDARPPYPGWFGYANQEEGRRPWALASVVINVHTEYARTIGLVRSR